MRIGMAMFPARPRQFRGNRAVFGGAGFDWSQNIKSVMFMRISHRVAAMANPATTREQRVVLPPDTNRTSNRSYTKGGNDDYP